MIQHIQVANNHFRQYLGNLQLHVKGIGATGMYVSNYLNSQKHLGQEDSRFEQISTDSGELACIRIGKTRYHF